jgi:hypothetical protein
VWARRDDKLRFRLRWSNSLAPSPWYLLRPAQALSGGGRCCLRCGARRDGKLRCRMRWSDPLAPSLVSTAVRSNSWQLRYVHVGLVVMTN